MDILIYVRLLVHKRGTYLSGISGQDWKNGMEEQLLDEGRPVRSQTPPISSVCSSFWVHVTHVSKYQQTIPARNLK